MYPMISKPILKALIKRYLRDAMILASNRRYSSAIYLSGYAVELALKYKICRLMIFSRGFPETRNEFSSYFSGDRRSIFPGSVRELRDIRHHDLSKLLCFSGEELNIQVNLSSEWELIRTWNPDMRYKNSVVRKSPCRLFLNSCNRFVEWIV